MKVVEDQLRNSRRKYLVPGSSKEVLFRGAPGTGKTFRLLEIALAHAHAERSVLLACYKTVLAAELRRMLLAGQATRAQSSLTLLTSSNSWTAIRHRAALSSCRKN